MRRCKILLADTLAELASSRMESLLGHWPEELDYSSFSVRLFPGRRREPSVCPMAFISDINL